MPRTSKRASKPTTASKAASKAADTTASTTAPVAPVEDNGGMAALAALVRTAPAAADASMPEPKCAQARLQRGRPHPSLLHIIASKGVHPGKAHRIRRWHRYDVGMSVLHCRITDGLDHLDIGYYVKHGLMKLRPMTDAERKAALAAWTGEVVPEAQPAAASQQEAASDAAASNAASDAQQPTSDAAAAS